jgi:putative transcriptional regulator
MKTKHDWTAADALTEEQIHAAALADPDAQPLTEERLAKMRRVPRTVSLRRALKLSQEEFAGRGGARLSARHRPRAGDGAPRAGALACNGIARLALIRGQALQHGNSRASSRPPS